MAHANSTIEEIGRPSAPEETRADSDTPGKPEKIGFFEQLSKYTEEEWQSLLAWVYRLAPITDRLATGNKAVYVQKYGGFFDEDTLKHDLGSGTYRIQLNQRGPRGNQKPIRQHIVDIEDLKFPPKVPEGEWVDDPRNKRWAWCRKKEDAAAANGSTPQILNPWTPESVLNFVKQLRPDAPKEDHQSITKAVLDAVKDTRTQMNEASDPTKLITIITQIVSLLRPAATEKTSTAEDPTFKLLFQQLADAREEAKAARDSAEKERQRIHEKEMEILKQRATASDPLDMVEKVMNLKERLGGDEPDKRNWKEKLVDEGMQHVPEILSLAKTFMSRPGYPRPMPPQNGVPTQQTVNQSTPMPSPLPPQPTPLVADQQQPQAAAPQTDPDIALLYTIFIEHGPKIVEAFKDDPNSGGECAAVVASKFVAGKAGYERVARMGRAKILAVVDLIPQMKADLAAAGTAEMLNDFIDDFIDPEDDDGPVIPERDASRSAAKIPKAKGKV